MGLKDKAINGVLWNTIGKFSSMGIEFIVGIILARLLSPKEFGLIGTITILISLSNVFINSGFSQAIIRKQNCTQEDYSTAFFFNFAVGVFFFILLFFTAGPLSVFFKNTELKPLIQVLGIGLIIGSLTLIQQATLTKRIDFKLQTKILISASTLSGIVSIILAYKGFGVWSLVAKQLLNISINSLLLWVFNRWKPSITFSRNSFKELFGFGSKLLLSGLIGTFFQNIYYLIIAKYFTAQDLGYFTRAEMFKKLPSESLSGIVTSVGYPVLATLQDDPIKMKYAFKEMLTNTFFIIVILMVGLAVCAHNLIIVLVGEQWLPSVILLQLLTITGIMYPLNSMNINILNVVGRSDLYLKLQLFPQFLIIPNVFVGVFFGIKALIIGMSVISVICYAIFNYESNKVLNYPLKEQLIDIVPSIIISLIMGIIVFLIGYFSQLNSLFTLLIQVLTGFILIIIIGEIFKNKEYLFLKTLLFSKIYNIISKKNLK